MTAIDGQDTRRPPRVLGQPQTESHADQRGASVRRLAHSAAGSFGLSVVQTAISTLTTIILARVMGVADFGVYAFVVATITLLAVPSILGVDRLLIRDVAVFVGNGSYGLARGLLSRSTQQTLVLATLIAAGSGLVAWLIAGRELTPELIAFWAGCIALPFIALARVAQGALMGLHHVVLGQSSELLVRPLLLLAGVIAAVAIFGPSLGAPLVVGLHALTCVLACLAGFLLLRSRRPSAMRSVPAVHRTGAWLAASLSLALFSSAQIINTQTGVALLGALGTPESAGLYSVAQRGALLVAFPLAAVNAAIAPTAARLWAAHDIAALQRLVTVSARGILLLSLPVAVIFCVFGRQLISLLFGAEYAPADVPLAILSVAQVVNAATGSVAVLLVMTGHQRQATVAIAIGASLNVLLGVILIPGYEEVGAAVAAATSLIVANVIMVVATRRGLRIDSTAIGRPLKQATA